MYHPPSVPSPWLIARLSVHTLEVASYEARAVNLRCLICRILTVFDQSTYSLPLPVPPSSKETSEIKLESSMPALSRLPLGRRELSATQQRSKSPESTGKKLPGVRNLSRSAAYAPGRVVQGASHTRVTLGQLSMSTVSKEVQCTQRS